MLTLVLLDSTLCIVSFRTFNSFFIVFCAGVPSKAEPKNSISETCSLDIVCSAKVCIQEDGDAEFPNSLQLHHPDSLSCFLLRRDLARRAQGKQGFRAGMALLKDSLQSDLFDVAQRLN